MENIHNKYKKRYMVVNMVKVYNKKSNHKTRKQVKRWYSYTEIYKHNKRIVLID